MIPKGILTGCLLAVVWISCAGASPSKGRPLTGSWGGQHAGLELTAQGGSIEYDCAHGTIDGPVVPDREGRFEAMGTHTAEHGGPVREGEEESGQPARYVGKVAGETMTLTVILSESGDEAGTFILTRGAPPRLVKCL